MLHRLFARLRDFFRRQRYQKIRKWVDIESLPGFKLDLGGGPASFFAAMYPRPEQVVLVDVDYNLALQAKQAHPALHIVVANGERLPLANGSMSITICNSVIEHVEKPELLAAEIQRVSKRYFVQTPNGRFPLETHSFIGIPFYRLIPWTSWRKLLCKLFGANFEYLESVRYLSQEKLKPLFPRAEITLERIFGVTKSFYIHDVKEKDL